MKKVDLTEMDKPQIIQHVEAAVDYTIYDVKWLPCSAKFIIMGCKANGTGIIQMYELNRNEVSKVKELKRNHAIKCGTFGASNLRSRHLAMGDYEGNLVVLDLERPEVPVYNKKAHKTIINAIDGIGGKQINCGPPEIVSGGRDGSVKVWDVRNHQGPVIDISPEQHKGDSINLARDCWAVTFGNSFNNEERLVASGYDNGDVKLFDLRNLKLYWETTLRNGVCNIEFDRKDIPINKMAVTTLEGGLFVYDMRTNHASKGFAYVEEKNAGRSIGSNGVISGPKATVWAARHLPQNRDLFVTCGGTGSLRLWKYDYPEKRFKDAGDGFNMGVPGTLEMLKAVTVSTQPVHCFDWHPDKAGLGVCGALDQTARVVIVSQLSKYL